VEQWTDGLQKKFEMLQSIMPWYTVQYFSPLAGIKFIKEEWHFENEPIVVVMNPQGDVFNENAFHMIREEGMSAFPFTGVVLEACHASTWTLRGKVIFTTLNEYTYISCAHIHACSFKQNS
jgi:hypothetical protein